ncbi:MAG: lamin tail domain-containing protein [Anaerolineae bacterium]|nr:lamin tail domain-containing protein [Anaerolineae bacterium]
MGTRKWLQIIISLTMSGVLLVISTLITQALPKRALPSQDALEYTATNTVITSSVVFNEIAWGGTTASPADEWIELHNTTARTITLTDWIITDGNDLTLTLVGDIAPGGYYLIERTDDNTVSNIVADWKGTFGHGLSNDGEILMLIDDQGITIDTANVDGGMWPTDNGNLTMERINPTAPDTADNWTSYHGSHSLALDAGGELIYGTPTLRNSAAFPAADLVVQQNGPDTVKVNTVHTYMLSIRNTGNITASYVYLSDTMPQATRYLMQTSPYTVTHPDPHTVIWDINMLPVQLTPTILLLAVTVLPTATNMLTNTVVATTVVTEATSYNNTAQWTTSVQLRSPKLHLHKTGPKVAPPDIALTYTLTLNNTGTLTATEVSITDILPDVLHFVTQTAPYPFTQLNPHTQLWSVSTLPPGTRSTITLVGTLNKTTLSVFTNTAMARDAIGNQVTTTWTTAVQPNVRLYALQPGNYGSISGEAAAIINLSSYPAQLTGWCLDDALTSTNRVCFPDGAEITAGKILWLAQTADGFQPIWGFDPHWAATTQGRPVPLLTGEWPGFSDNGESAYLLDAQGQLADTLVYGQNTTAAGWEGPAVPHPYPGYDNRGQVLYRKLNATNGYPVTDTHRATDWAQDPDDPINGRKIRYPGWDLESLFSPLTLNNTANVTLAIAPEGTLALVNQTLATARKRILFEGYTISSIPLYETINARLQAGVIFTALLESNPSGGMNDEERWVAQHLHHPPTSTVILMGGATARYQFQHAKFMVIDDRLALISTDNFGESSLPSDLKANGTMGHRGFILVTDDMDVIAYLIHLFNLDCDPAHHTDVFSYSEFYDPPEDFIPIPTIDWTTYTATFSGTVIVTAQNITLMHAPEHSLRAQDALLGLINTTTAGDRVDVMQLNETLMWGDPDTTTPSNAPAYNPRIIALARAAQRGVEVRLLLDAYYDDPTDNNGNTAVCLYLKDLHLPRLSCRLANVTGLGIHAKLFLIQRNAEKWLNLGSINGTETSNKLNRELAIQFTSPAAYDALITIFDHDWAQGHPPMRQRLYLPVIVRAYEPPITYPVITEVMINPLGEDSTQEWIEIYHPGREILSLTQWTIGDALNAEDYGDGTLLFPVEAQLFPHQVIIIAACATEFASCYGFNPTYEWTDCDVNVPNMLPAGAWEGFGVALGNIQDEVIFTVPGGTPIDSVAWGGDPRADIIPFQMDPDSTFPWDATLKRYPVDYDTGNCVTDFYVSYTPSPGKVSGGK